jgi:hemin uptake protein HemP
MQPDPNISSNVRRAGGLPADRAEALRCVHSRDLLAGGNLIQIEHAGERYFLRQTRNNKLILTK